jgi:hypothetical protein
MTHQTAGVFTIEYTLFTRAEPDHDIQFGMDFSLTSTVKEPLTQLIFPVAAVGNNMPGKWNIDNHNPASLVFSNAEHGTITDKPREIIGQHKGVKTTKFAVYLVDPKAGKVKSAGVEFGYKIDTGAAKPETTFTGFKPLKIPGDQKAVIQAHSSHIKFV